MRQNSAEQDKKQQSGRWTKEQHQRFMYGKKVPYKAIVQYGKEWKKVEQYVKTRTGSQVRSHAQKFFNQLGKINPTQQGLQRNQQQHSQTQFDMEREINNEFTPTTPLELVSLIKKQSKESGGKVSLDSLQKKLKQTQEITNKQKGKSVQTGQIKPNTYKSMRNILSAYEGIKQQNNQTFNEDEGFLILITKRYKKYLSPSGFNNLIDFKNAPIEPNSESVARKRSFTLPQGRDLSSDEAQQQIQEIKRQINTQKVQKRKNSAQKTQQKQRRQQKDSERQINFSSSSNRLATIQQQVKQQEQLNSFVVIPNVELGKQSIQIHKKKSQ